MGKRDYIGNILLSPTGTSPMTEPGRAIIVVDRDAGLAERVKGLVEFMDSHCVLTARPDDWQSRLGPRRLEAMFVGPGLSDEVVGGLLADLERFDPGVAVVMIQGRA